MTRYVVTDQGAQFTSAAFKELLQSHHIKHREGAIGQHGSIAVIERLWLTLKQALDVDRVPDLHFADFQRRFGAAIDWYARRRPHTYLRGATPHERYLGLRPACEDAVSPPRALAGVVMPKPPIELHYALPLEKRLPYLVRSAA